MIHSTWLISSWTFASGWIRMLFEIYLLGLLLEKLDEKKKIQVAYIDIEK